MNPFQKNKVDISTLKEEEARLRARYGNKLPSRSDHFAKHLKDRKYFDSGDYAMSKAGKGDSVDTGSVGSQHPVPENIPHLTSPSQSNNNNNNNTPNNNNGQPAHLHLQPPQNNQANTGGSPVKETSHLQRETSADEAEEKTGEDNKDGEASKDAEANTGADADSQTIPRR